MIFSLTSRGLISCISAFALSSCFALSAIADDIDVYNAKIANQKKPNVLFVLDYSGSMASSINGVPKITILKNAMAELLDNNLNRINAGLGPMYDTKTTGIKWPISELSADANTVDPGIPAGMFTVRDMIKQQVDAGSTGVATATVDALVQSAKYYRGLPVTHNDTTITSNHKPDLWDGISGEYAGGFENASLASTYSPSNAYNEDLSGIYYCDDYSTSGGPDFCADKTVFNCVARTPGDAQTAGFERFTNLWGNYQQCQYTRNAAWVGARYNSPATQTCQSNSIILISDGLPNVVTDGASLQSVAGTSLSGCEDLSTSTFAASTSYSTGGNCAIEILQALSSTDVNPSIAGSAVKTYTIGFDLDNVGETFMRQLAVAGDGDFYSADEPGELSDALNAILDEILGGSENFAELSIDVNNATFSHDNRAYFSLFAPGTRQSWQGNLKGYFVESGGLVDITGNAATVVSAGGLQFSETAQSFWSSEVDGNDVLKGGASAKLANATRNLYTYVGDTIPSGGVNLASGSGNLLQSTNSSITAEMMGLASGSTQRETALDWIQTAPMGDPLHTKSVTLNYGTSRVVYISTNQGFLHAFDASNPVDYATGIDTSGGNELFAFMPKRLLANLPALEANSNDPGHIYGLDGSITRWHDDLDNDGVVDTGETVLLIVGMRRGGNAYYALDVSNPLSPVLKWKIDGDDADFPRLAQSWSRMSLIKVSDGGTHKKVLAFAAGYDAALQDDSTGLVESKGNAIYMIDKDKNKLWEVDSDDHDDMDYSIASDLTIINSDSDTESLADRIYVGDVAGQLWRVDFGDIDNTPEVEKLADFRAENQKFFYPPSVAFNQSYSGNYLSITIGSGNRTDPLEQSIVNNLYMIRDTAIATSLPAGFTTVTHSLLHDATNNPIESTNSSTASDAALDLESKRGWRIRLPAGEKSLSSPITFEGKVLATTFLADPSVSDSLCGYTTMGKLYSMRVDNAAPLGFSSDDPPPPPGDPNSRTRLLNGTGIPSSPVIVFPENSGNVQIYVDKEAVGLFDQTINSVYWHAR
ncbi:MAG: hypothetical protein KTR32_28100 [Granulosicoccus sp.]|nr:hypothetical protein [Granulosicoccus sp.]